MGEGLGPLFLVVMYSLLVLSTIFMALRCGTVRARFVGWVSLGSWIGGLTSRLRGMVSRFYCRASIVKMVGPDDWIMLAAFVNAWGLGITNHFQIKYGIGAHAADAPPYDEVIIPTLKLWYVYQLQYLVTLFLIKSSILSFYRRISPERGYQLSITIVSCIVVAFTVAMLFVNVFECPKDPSRAWSRGFPSGCNDLVAVYYFMAAFNIISDIVILVLPMPSLLRLQINRRKRVALILIFSCGAIVVVASAVRISALYKNQYTIKTGGDIPCRYSTPLLLAPILTIFLDVATYVLLWSQVEVNVGIITACAPALKPLVHSVLQGTSHARNGYAQKAIGYSGTGQRNNHAIPLRSLGCKEANKSHGNTTTVDAGSSESQEDIVFKGDGIVRTVEVKVDMEVDGRSEDSIRQLEFGPQRV
ncbi:unnamed protein product [Tuber aestivum]|uniref:Rhodopsin domain-containing protein n=1 Tax=Tuber aestivum TaxID=59557 RepID=A0A292PTJ1_9PEZI|nr:unnamed protein product [Tuber aestivum]